MDREQWSKPEHNDLGDMVQYLYLDEKHRVKKVIRKEKVWGYVPQFRTGKWPYTWNWYWHQAGPRITRTTVAAISHIKHNNRKS